MDERCISGLESLPAAARSCVLTIGNFDGVHVGHRRIVEAARALADRQGGAVVAMTFEPPPDLVLRPDDAPQRLVPPGVKCELLREAGCDWVVTAKADRALLALEPGEFVEQVIVRHFAPRWIVEGPNFSFGRARAGSVDALRQAGASAAFDVHVAEPVALELSDGREIVSSTLIRSLVAAGRAAEAARCLGRDFALYGRVVPGEGLGRKLQYPTANLAPGEQICPGDGVYAGLAELAGREYAAAVSIGTKPTFTDGQAGERTVEAFLLDASGDFYGAAMKLSFVRRLRDQRRYDGPEALKAQLARDVERVREIVAAGGRKSVGSGR